MSGRGGRGRGPSPGAARPNKSKLDLLKRGSSRSPARGGALSVGAGRGAKKESSPGRGSPASQVRGRGGKGRGVSSPRGSPAGRGKSKLASPATNTEKSARDKGDKVKVTEEKTAAVAEENPRKRKKLMPKISENPEAPIMSDMENMRSSGRSSETTTNGELKNGTEHHQPNGFVKSDSPPPAADELHTTAAAGGGGGETAEVKTMISEMVSNMSTDILDRIGTVPPVQEQVPKSEPDLKPAVDGLVTRSDEVNHVKRQTLPEQTGLTSADAAEPKQEVNQVDKVDCVDDESVNKSTKDLGPLDKSNGDESMSLESTPLVRTSSTSGRSQDQNNTKSSSRDESSNKCDKIELDKDQLLTERSGDGDVGATGAEPPGVVGHADNVDAKDQNAGAVESAVGAGQESTDGGTAAPVGVSSAKPANPPRDVSVTAISLDELEKGMVPVQSVQIEHIRADGTTTNIKSLELEDVPLDQVPVVLYNDQADMIMNHGLPFDKSQLFSKMNDSFKKGTDMHLNRQKKKSSTEDGSKKPKKEKIESVQVPKPLPSADPGDTKKQKTVTGEPFIPTKPDLKLESTLSSLPASAPPLPPPPPSMPPLSIPPLTAPRLTPSTSAVVPPPFAPPLTPLSDSKLPAAALGGGIPTNSPAAVSASLIVPVGLSVMPSTAALPLSVPLSPILPLPPIVTKTPELSKTKTESEPSFGVKEEEFPSPPVLEKQVDLDPPRDSASNEDEVDNSYTYPEKSVSPSRQLVVTPLSKVQDSKPGLLETALKGQINKSDASSYLPGKSSLTDGQATEINAPEASVPLIQVPAAVISPGKPGNLLADGLVVKADAGQADQLSVEEADVAQKSLEAYTNSVESESTDLPVNNSELTKSLRKVRLAKKSPTKNAKSDDSLTVSDSGSPPKSVSPCRQKSYIAGGAGGVGTQVYDFTDDEDIPLNDIDLEALNQTSEEGRKSNLLVTGNVMSSAPLEITIPDPQQAMQNTITPRGGITVKTPQKPRYEVSPTILSKEDAIAAVIAVQSTAGNSVFQQMKMNGEMMSDDTDTSMRSGTEKVKVGKRRKRRMMESDGGDTEDDLDHKKDVRPKRNKPAPVPSGESVNAATRPSSAASGTSTTSARDLEDRRHHLEDQDGKHSPDAEEKPGGKALSTVVPEKASSFNIHPERTCADCCYYCSQKFGMLDTPLHVAQLKTHDKQGEAMKMTGFGLDACLCDRCFRFLDRKAQAKDVAGGKLASSKEDKEEKVKKCLIRTCNKAVTGSVSKKWLIRLKKRLMKKVTMDWDRVAKASAKATFLLCAKHTSMVEFYSNCGLCKQKLNVAGICTLGMTKKDVEDMNILLREDHIPADLKENNFVCKLCKTFCGIKQKSLQPDYLKNHKTHKAFYKDYRRRLYQFLEIGNEEEDEPASSGSTANPTKPGDKHPKKLFKVSQSAEGSCKITISAHTPDTGGDRKRRKEKDFASPSSESKIQVNSGRGDASLLDGGDVTDKCEVNIQFDLNTKKLWQDLHYPYGSHTSFLRHLILLEKYWRSGDLTLASSASLKASSYLKSVRNRITAYEGKHSNADLSASTRPDLDEPAAPTLTHVPGEEVFANLPTDLPSPKLDPVKESTILKIPRVPNSSTLLSPNSASILSPESLELTTLANSAAGASPKIRVRQDLMQHLGLVAKSSANIVQNDRKPAKSSQPTTTTTTTASSIASQPTSVTTSVSTTPNLAKLLSETSSNYGVEEKVGMKSSNSQLFKSTESSGAIPLTFNNSIAEVLAAANKAKINKSREPSPKPEITITAKSTGKGMDRSSLDGLAKLVKKTSNSSGAGTGALSILKRTVTSGSASVNPISNMTKLLQNQAPGLPPHIIAQQAMTATRASPKVMSRPPGPASSNFRPVQISSGKPTGIQTVNKKSLHTVLDRLNPLQQAGGGGGGSPTKPSSSLVQQLQAPLVSNSRSQTVIKPNKASKESAAAIRAAQLQKALAAAGGSGSSAQSSPSALTTTLTSALPGNILVPSSMAGVQISQPLVQFPSAGQGIDPTSLMFPNLMGNQNMAAALMAASMGGMTQQQAVELIQQQQQLLNQPQSRMRAPPPLKNMSRKPD